MLARQLGFAGGFESMPPDFKQMAELLGPMVMSQIPGAFDAGQFY